MKNRQESENSGHDRRLGRRSKVPHPDYLTVNRWIQAGRGWFAGRDRKIPEARKADWVSAKAGWNSPPGFRLFIGRRRRRTATEFYPFLWPVASRSNDAAEYLVKSFSRRAAPLSLSLALDTADSTAIARTIMATRCCDSPLCGEFIGGWGDTGGWWLQEARFEDESRLTIRYYIIFQLQELKCATLEFEFITNLRFFSFYPLWIPNILFSAVYLAIA